MSCSTSSTLVKTAPINDEKTFNLVEQQVHMIDSYISKIDSKVKNNTDFTINDLVIHGNLRIITTDEFRKDVVLKNKSIVRVKYNNHLHNNFIKSNVFYYDKNELVCIKIQDILPNEHNKSTVYKRIIYIKDNYPILDSDTDNLENPINDLVHKGLEYLKDEYSSLH